LTVDVDGAEVTGEKYSGVRRALWRMPDGFDRYSGRDTGGDDWASRGTYNWLAANRNSIMRINDISGEHGRNIGHSTHKHGSDIDMFHFYTFPKGGASGTENYNQLIKNVLSSKNTDSSDQNKKKRKPKPPKSALSNGSRQADRG
jgi:hypothetical protein